MGDQIKNQEKVIICKVDAKHPLKDVEETLNQDTKTTQGQI